jgi:hypothetical protein
MGCHRQPMAALIARIRRPDRTRYRVHPKRKLCPRIGAGEPDRNPLASSGLELDRGPMARRTPAIDAAAPDPFASLEIGVLVKAFDEAAGVGRDCRFPFGAAPEQSKEHANLHPTMERTICTQIGNKASTNYKNARDFSGTGKKVFATVICFELLNWAMNFSPRMKKKD